MKKWFILAVIAVVIAFCVHYRQQIREVILGAVDWSDVDETTPEIVQRTAEAVGYFVIETRQGYQGRCTGFRVAPYHYITNQHCIEDMLTIEGVFNGQRAAGQVISQSREFDYALIHIQGIEGYSVKISNDITESGGIIHYQCDYRQSNCTPDFKWQICDIDNDGGDLTHYCDTLGGSSGSPIFNDKWELVGLHYAGLLNTHNLAKAFYTINYEIQPHLNMKLPDNRSEIHAFGCSIVEESKFECSFESIP